MTLRGGLHITLSIIEPEHNLLYTDTGTAVAKNASQPAAYCTNSFICLMNAKALLQLTIALYCRQCPITTTPKMPPTHPPTSPSKIT